MGFHLLAFIEYPPLNLTEGERLRGQGPHLFFCELRFGEHAPDLLGHFAHREAFAVTPAGLSRQAKDRFEIQASEVIATNIVGLGLEDLERIAEENPGTAARPFPRTLRAVIESIRALGPGARLIYWFES